MARPERNTVDYYPHFVGEGKKMFFIEQKYGNDGYATWHKLLEKLASSDYHFLDLSKEEEVMFLAAKCRISEETLICIITDLCKLGVFDKKLWENQIIWCQYFIDNIQDAYKRRNNECISYNGLCEHLSGLGRLKPELSSKTDDNKPQSRVEKSREEKKRVYTAPTLDEVKQYFSEKGYSEEGAQRAYEYYDTGGWKDRDGKQVKNWKQKMLSVWFRDEFKIKKSEPKQLVFVP